MWSGETGVEIESFVISFVFSGGVTRREVTRADTYGN